MTAHHLDLVPRRVFDGQWQEVVCWLDRQIDDVVIACGWRGQSLGLSPEALLGFYGDLDDEVAFAAAQSEFDVRHLAEVLMADVAPTALQDLVDHVPSETLTV